MLTKLSNNFLKISTGRLTLFCLAIFIVFSALVLPDQAARAEVYSGEVGSPDTSLFYTASDLTRMAEAYGPTGRSAYIRSRFTFDLIFPLVYTAFLVTAISWLVKQADLTWDTWGRLNLMPLAGMVFDFLENTSTATVMSRFPQTTPLLDHLSGVFTLIKWVFVGGSFIALIILAIIALVHWTRSRQESTDQ